jgi:hypothetical protein
VIDMSDDAEIPNPCRRGERVVGETSDGNLLVDGGSAVDAQVI